MMISFIIIGRNEGLKITKCIESVFSLIRHNQLHSYEIIYVDSKSTDDSLEKAKKFGKVLIFQLTADYNAAIARNVGAKESSGDILFFIDGDMAINEKFNIKEALTTAENNFMVTGKVNELIFNEKNLLINSYERQYPKGMMGGVFIIRKNLYQKFAGMDERFLKGQDYEFFIRLRKKGYLLVTINDTICNHQTLGYRSKSRIKHSYINHSIFRGLLFRKHFPDGSLIKLFIYEYYPNIAFLLSVLIGWVLSIWSFYVLSVLLFVYLATRKLKKQFNFINLCYEFLKIAFLILGFFYWPARKKSSYILIGHS